MCQRSGLRNILLLVISSLFLLAFVVGRVTVPAQAKQTSPASVQAVATVGPTATASPGATPKVHPTATAVQNKQRAQQGKQLGNENFWSWTALRLLLARRGAGGQRPLLGVSIPPNQPLVRIAVLALAVAILAVAVVKGQPRPLGDRTVPEPPPTSVFVARPTQLAQLRDALLDENGRRPRRVALVGMGGVGKSVLAEAAARDPAIQKVYPDAPWVPLRRELPLKDSQYLLAKRLGSTDAVINVEDGHGRCGRT